MKRFAFVVVALVACGDDDSPAQPDAQMVDADPRPVIDCDVAIIGGGAGGTHTAFRLVPTLGQGVCLFEKEAVLGGRLKDIPKDGSPNSPVFGAGGMRVMEGQTLVFNLATELGITFETPDTESDFINARGSWAFAKEDLVDLYGVTADTGPDADTESMLYYALDLQAARPDIANYADFKSYIVGKIGGEGLAFLHDMSRFRADFEYPIDARSYMDYLDEEWDVCCTPSYPIGGMTQFLIKMGAKITEGGGRIFTSEAVETIDANGAAYRLTTSKQIVNATKIVIAVPPTAIARIEGDVIDALMNQPQMKEILPVKVVTIANWWPTRWYENLTNPGADVGKENLWRAWSTEHCFNLIEMPLQPYAFDQMVTRSVYDDDRNCVEFWETLYTLGGEAAVNAEIRRGLTYMFNGTNPAPGGTPVTIPMPVKTHVQIWEDAWHWLKAGATSTNAEIADWAVAPLGMDKNVSLVGEAYYLNRSGWSDAAYKSSIKLLNARYGLTIPLPRTTPYNKFKYPKVRWANRRN